MLGALSASLAPNWLSVLSLFLSDTHDNTQCLPAEEIKDDHEVNDP